MDLQKKKEIRDQVEADRKAIYEAKQKDWAEKRRLREEKSAAYR